MAAILEARPAGNCRMCGAALGGPLSYVSLVLGVRRSQRNPNLCNRCAAHMKEGEVVEITALFADLAGFTRLTQSLGPEKTSTIVDGFLRATSHAIHRHDGVVDKYIGDEVVDLVFCVQMRCVTRLDLTPNSPSGAFPGSQAAESLSTPIAAGRTLASTRPDPVTRRVLGPRGVPAPDARPGSNLGGRQRFGARAPFRAVGDVA